MNGAVIDLGTNTFNLVIFNKTDDGYSILSKHKQSVNLGMGGINENIISKAAMDRAFNALKEFKLRCVDYKVDKIIALGTSALRGAKNTPSFVKFIKEQLEIEINIINGHEEAGLIYEGVNSIHSFEVPSCIMDIGGGSTEFIFVENGKLITKESFDIGVSRIIQKFDLEDPLSDKDISTITDFFEKETKGFFDKYKSDDLIGASGSFETYYELVTGETNLIINHSKLIPFNSLIKTLNYLISATAFERCENTHIPQYREPMIHVAALKTKWVIEKLKVKQCFMSPASLKEGAIETLF